MHILILGCGKSGSALAQQLYQNGHQVTTVSRHPQTLSGICHLVQNVHQLDVSAVPAIDWVYVLLSPTQRSTNAYLDTFYHSARPIFQALQHHPIQKMVLVSSTRVYGENQGQWINDSTVARPTDPIAQCLLQAEQLWRHYWHERLIIIRPSGLYDEQSTFLLQIAQNTQQFNTLHWCNYLYRPDFIGLSSALLQQSHWQTHYILTDRQPQLRHHIINRLRQQLGLAALTIADNLPTTGKRLQAQHIQSFNYSWQQPILDPSIFIPHKNIPH